MRLEPRSTLQTKWVPVGDTKWVVMIVKKLLAAALLGVAVCCRE